MDDLIYRITSLEGFLSLLVNKKERFVRPIDCWEDTFEGYMLHLLDSDEGTLKVIEKLHNEISNRITDVTIRNFTKLQRCRFASYGMCWSKVKDSDAMWRIYSYDKKAIQLISSKQSVENMLLNAKWNRSSFDIYDVKYDIYDEDDAINKIMRRNSKIVSAYFHKRPAFEHEQEVRVLVYDRNEYDHLEAFSNQAIKVNLKHTDETKTIPERIQQAIATFGGTDTYRKIAPESVYADVEDLKSYITGVRVHPQAQDWYVELVKKICESYGLAFEGKSDLYREVV